MQAPAGEGQAAGLKETDWQCVKSDHPRRL